LLAAFAASPAAPTPPFRIAADVSDTERGLRFESMAASVGESRAEGRAALSFGPDRRPKLSLNLVAPRLVPRDFGWLPTIGSEQHEGSVSWADTPLPVAWLRWIDARGDLHVERLEGVAAGTADLRIGFELERGRLRVEPLRLGIAQGVAEGGATIDAGEGVPPEVSLRMDAGGMRLVPLLAAFGVDQVAGQLAAAAVDLRGRGATPREIAAGLDGAARFRIVDGSIDVPDLSRISMGLLETFGYVLGGGGSGGGDAPTPVACAVGDLPVREGVVHAKQLVAVTPRVVIAGKGTVRLAEGTMRLTLVPKPVEEALFRILVPVVISGELASPEVTRHPELRAGLRPERAADICEGDANRG
jgi:hypothetical protein